MKAPDLRSWIPGENLDFVRVPLDPENFESGIGAGRVLPVKEIVRFVKRVSFQAGPEQVRPQLTDEVPRSVHAEDYARAGVTCGMGGEESDPDSPEQAFLKLLGESPDDVKFMDLPAVRVAVECSECSGGGIDPMTVEIGNPVGSGMRVENLICKKCGGKGFLARWAPVDALGDLVLASFAGKVPKLLKMLKEQTVRDLMES